MAPTRRAQKTALLLHPRAAPARHARRGRPLGALAGVAVAVALVFGSAMAVTGAVSGAPVTASEVGDQPADPPTMRLTVPLPARAESIPAPVVNAAPAAVELCADPALTDALSAGDDAAAIAAAGGAEAFRSAVATGLASCIALDDPARVWAVLNKARAAAPLEYQPASLSLPDGVRSIEGGSLRSDAAAALSGMVAAATAAGVGEIALESGFRSFETQQTSYGNQVNSRGVAQADLVSARPGFSEHQTGLAGDVVACGGGCGSLDDLAASAQGQWILEHAWEFGWITRYEAAQTPVTGYSPEPWHLRYIGPDLARAYHDGGWHTLEQFFGLDAAPAYLD